MVTKKELFQGIKIKKVHDSDICIVYELEKDPNVCELYIDKQLYALASNPSGQLKNEFNTAAMVLREA